MKRFIISAAVIITSLTAAAQSKTVIVQVSDTQFGFWDDKKIDYEVKTYSKCIEEINTLHPDIVVLTGDLVNHTWFEEQWKALEDITNRLDNTIPVMYIPGNHDINFRKGKLNMDDYHAHIKYTRFAKKIKGAYLIGLDSNPIKECYGQQQEIEQYQWLEKILKKNRHKRTPIIFTHHPFFLENFDEDEGYFQLSKEARKKYFDLFEKYGVKGVFSGHLHQNRIASYKDLFPVITTSAIGVQLGKDKSGYRIITIENGKISHEYKNVDID